MILLLLLACAPDDCDALCDAALVRFEACLAERGETWGPSVGYTDAADYANWCATYAWELRQLGEADTCAETRTTLEGGTCEDAAAAWSTP